MATEINKLDPLKLDGLAPGRHKDGGGLVLVKRDSGATSWTLEFSFCGRKREMGLGVYPSVKLATARKLAREAKT